MFGINHTKNRYKTIENFGQIIQIFEKLGKGWMLCAVKKFYCKISCQKTWNSAI